MADVYGEIRSLLATPVDTLVNHEGSTKKERAIANVIAEAQLRSADQATAISYLASHPDTLAGHLNLTAILRHIDHHVMNNPLELKHFRWSIQEGRPFAYFGPGRLQLSESLLGWKCSYYNLDAPEDSFDGYWTQTPEQALKETLSKGLYKHPDSPFEGYARWIKAGRRPSQYGLLPPEDFDRVQEFTWAITQNQVARIPVIRPIPNANRLVTFRINRGLCSIGIPLPPNREGDFLPYVKDCLLEAWEFYGQQEHPYVARSFRTVGLLLEPINLLTPFVQESNLDSLVQDDIR